MTITNINRAENVNNWCNLFYIKKREEETKLKREREKKKEK